MEYKRFKYSDVFNISVHDIISIKVTKKKYTKALKGVTPVNERISPYKHFKISPYVPTKISPRVLTKISPRVPVKIGEVSMGPGVSISANDNFSGVSLVKNIGNDISGYVENGVLIIKGFYE